VRDPKQGAWFGACLAPMRRARLSCCRARAGLMAQLAAQLFARLAAARAANAHGGATVHMTAFEIMNERVADLLAAPSQQLRGRPGAGQAPRKRLCCARRAPRPLFGWRPSHIRHTFSVTAGTRVNSIFAAGPRHNVFADSGGRTHVANLAALPLAGAADFEAALEAVRARRAVDPDGPRRGSPARHGAATFVVTLLVAARSAGAPRCLAKADRRLLAATVKLLAAACSGALSMDACCGSKGCWASLVMHG